MRRHLDFNRRQVLRASLGAGLAGGAAMAVPLRILMARSAFREAAPDASRSPYGPLAPARDEATGLTLLELPEGFRYTSLGWTGDPMIGGVPRGGRTVTPPAHDGMAVAWAGDGKLLLVRNHELRSDGPAFEAPAIYDPGSQGGTSNLLFDAEAGRLEKAWMSLGGTSVNCAGGPTTWGSWLTCEETVTSPAPGRGPDDPPTFRRPHGYIFEVPAFEDPTAEPLKAMGRFVHEAVAVDPQSGVVYETEDANPAGFYRFLPDEPGRLSKGGRLEMLAVRGRPNADLRGMMDVDRPFDVDWVPIDDPDPALEKGRASVFVQGSGRGGAKFARLEGCWPRNGRIDFISTSGGDGPIFGKQGSGHGQVWEYDPEGMTLRCLFQSRSHAELSNPDNMTVSPRGGILLCEDGDHDALRLQLLTDDGKVYPFARNNVVLDGRRNGLKGDYRATEWAGASFSPDGRWLFVNIQNPGITFAITGPWHEGPLG